MRSTIVSCLCHHGKAVAPPDDNPRPGFDEASISALAWDRDGETLTKVVTRANFAEALAYVNAVGELAEARNHHPDIAISWNKVTLSLTTHSAGRLTAADVELARAIDSI